MGERECTVFTKELYQRTETLLRDDFQRILDSGGRSVKAMDVVVFMDKVNRQDPDLYQAIHAAKRASTTKGDPIYNFLNGIFKKEGQSGEESGKPVKCI